MIAQLFLQLKCVYSFLFEIEIKLISKHLYRYYAVKFPLSNQNKWLMAKSQYILIIGWLLGIGWASIPNTKIETFIWDNNTYQDCRPDHELYESRWYNISSVTITFVLPLIIQSICYASIIWCLLCKDHNLQSSKSFAKQNRDMTRIIRMLVAVVIIFLICWSPIKILMTVITYSPEWLFIHDPSSNTFYIASYFICHWMAMANSFVNPIIYSFMSKSFRIDLHDLARKICGGHNNNNHQNNNKNNSRHYYYNGYYYGRSSYRQNSQNSQQQQQQQQKQRPSSSSSITITNNSTNNSEENHSQRSNKSITSDVNNNNNIRNNNRRRFPLCSFVYFIRINNDK